MSSDEPRKYTREFKLEAVRLSDHAEISAAQVARDLGLRDRVLYRWRQQFRELEQRAFPGSSHPNKSELEVENQHLQCEVERQRQERDILRKVVAIFSQLQS